MQYHQLLLFQQLEAFHFMHTKVSPVRFPLQLHMLHFNSLNACHPKERMTKRLCVKDSKMVNF